MKGFIRIKCSACGHEFRHLADFPDASYGFVNFQCFCPHCLSELLITDGHTYNVDGDIIG